MWQKSDVIILKRIIWKKRFLLLSVLVSVIAAILFFISIIGVIVRSSRKTIQTRNDIANLKKKVSMVDKDSVAALAEVQNNIELFLPRTFDLFSVISFIDVVSRKTNLRVDSIVLSGKESSSSVVQSKSVNILGDMTFEEFLSFLEKYKYITGRFLAIQNVNITTIGKDSIQLSAEIYTFDPAVDLNSFIIGSLTPQDKAVLTKIVEATKNNDVPVQEIVEDNYSNKSDPFQ